MTYYFAKTLPGPFEAVVASVRQALQREGFGVITEIDVQAVLHAKIQVDFHPYLILGACNPAMAHAALKIEDKVGIMLPCNVVIQALPSGLIEVAAVDPVASMRVVDNSTLIVVAEQVAEKLKAVIESL